MPILLLTLSEALADSWRTALGRAHCWRVADVATLADSLQDGQLVLADLVLPGIEAANWPALCRQGRVIAMSSDPDNGEGLRWLQQGAAGYAHAYSTADLLQQIVSTVKTGSSWVGRDLLALLCGQLGSKLPDSGQEAWRSQVTAREAEVIAALKRGMANKEIARELDIAERTVKAHLSSLFHKFGVDDRLQLLLKLA